MILDPKAILHLMLVEFRWIVLLYFTLFQLIVSTSLSIAHSTESQYFTDMILCTGTAKFDVMMGEAEANRMFFPSDHDKYSYKLEVDSCDPEGPCALKDCSVYERGLASCACSHEVWGRGSNPFYLNMTMIGVMLVPYGLLVVYCILFKSGQFEGLAAKQDYIESCQSVQNSGVFRTYCNILAFVCAGGLVYGLETSQRQGDQQATQNLIISGLAMIGLIRAPHRYGSTAGDYNLEILQKHRMGPITNISRLLLWDSTRYYEEFMRAVKYDSAHDDDGKPIHNPTFVGAAGDEETGNNAKTAMVKKNKGYGECFGCCN